MNLEQYKHAIAQLGQHTRTSDNGNLLLRRRQELESLDEQAQEALRRALIHIQTESGLPWFEVLKSSGNLEMLRPEIKIKATHGGGLLVEHISLHDDVAREISTKYNDLNIKYDLVELLGNINDVGNALATMLVSEVMSRDELLELLAEKYAKAGKRLAKLQYTNHFYLRQSTSRFMSLDDRQHEDTIAENYIMPIVGDVFPEEPGRKVVVHKGASRAMGALQNFDLACLSVSETYDGQRILLRLVEFKIKNDASSLYKAVAQAISYKPFCNEAYILAPDLTEESRDTDDDLKRVFEVCHQNGVGILTAASDDQMKFDENDLRIRTTLPAASLGIEDSCILDSVFENAGLSFCPKCRKVTTKEVESELTLTCGWPIRIEGEEYCFRKVEEQNLIGLVQAKSEVV